MLVLVLDLLLLLLSFGFFGKIPSYCQLNVTGEQAKIDVGDGYMMSDVFGGV